MKQRGSKESSQVLTFNLVCKCSTMLQYAEVTFSQIAHSHKSAVSVVLLRFHSWGVGCEFARSAACKRDCGRYVVFKSSSQSNVEGTSSANIPSPQLLCFAVWQQRNYMVLSLAFAQYGSFLRALIANRKHLESFHTSLLSLHDYSKAREERGER